MDFCKDRGYHLTVEEEHQSYMSYDEFLVEFNKIDLPFEPHDYQIKAVYKALKERRLLCLSPTGSGKSYIIYLIMKMLGKKTLIVTCTTGLVAQMAKDLAGYGWDENKIGLIFSGQSKDVEDFDVVVSTWQSLYKLPEGFFEQFDIIVGDECHLFKAKSLSTLMEKTKGQEYKFGFTGTLDDTQTHRLVLEGLFGEVYKTKTTKQLIDDKKLAKVNVHSIILSYNDAERKLARTMTYQQEIDFILAHKKRLQFFSDMSEHLAGTSVYLFNYVEKHGVPLYNALKLANKTKPTYLITGKTPVEEREYIRNLADREEIDIVASFGTFATGINVVSIRNVIFTHPVKGKIRNLQSIGRGIRRKEGEKEEVSIWDFGDDLHSKSKINTTMKHFHLRYERYLEEGFNVKIKKRKLGD